MTGLGQIAAAFTQTLWTTRAGQTRDDFERWQARTLQHWLARDLPAVDFYRSAPPRLEALPVIDKAAVMADFAAFNRGRITAEEGWRAYETTGSHAGVSIGASTGTSGNRALYAITPAEQHRWLGTILAKALPRFLLGPERVAVILPQNSALYDGANRSRLLRLRFLDLRQGLERLLPELEAFAPTTIVAPPRVLRHLAEHAKRLSPRRLFAGAETLDRLADSTVHLGMADQAQVTVGAEHEESATLGRYLRSVVAGERRLEEILSRLLQAADRLHALGVAADQIRSASG